MPNNNSQNNSRRSFIRNISMATAFFMTGKVGRISAEEVYDFRKKVALRFVVASDAHYGQPKTLFDELIDKMTSQVNSFHQSNPLDFCVINGDIIHNEKPLMPLAKQKLDQLSMPYYVTRGNHDMLSDAEWKTTWNTPLNQAVVVKKTALLLGDTSNEKGEYLSPDLNWLKDSLDKHSKRKQVFLFLHIPQAKWTANGIETPAFFELVKNYPNIKAVFHGHEHDQDSVRMRDNIPYLFDSHIGGNWGTEYKGFRVVELMNDGSMITYMMNPVDRINDLTY
jgi:Icc protein